MIFVNFSSGTEFIIPVHSKFQQSISFYGLSMEDTLFMQSLFLNSLEENWNILWLLMPKYYAILTVLVQ